jgi:hypothetical protein
VGAFPNLAGIAEGFEARCQVARSVADLDGPGPGRESGREKESVEKPRVFEMGARRTGDRRGCRNKDTNVIGGGAVKGGEEGVGEG